MFAPAERDVERKNLVHIEVMGLKCVLTDDTARCNDRLLEVEIKESKLDMRFWKNRLALRCLVRAKIDYLNPICQLPEPLLRWVRFCHFRPILKSSIARLTEASFTVTRLARFGVICDQRRMCGRH
jgi:hypothetical protein